MTAPVSRLSSRPLKVGEILDEALISFGYLMPHVIGLMIFAACIEQLGGQLPRDAVFSVYSLTVIVWILPFLSMALLIEMIKRVRIGQPVSFRSALASLSLRRVAGVTALSVWIMTVTIAGLICLIAPGILYSVNRVLAVPVYVIENCSMSEAIWRSKFLMTRGRWYSINSPMMRVSVVVFVVVVVVSSLSMGHQVRDYFAWGEGVSGWGNLVMGIFAGLFAQVLGNFGTVVYTLFYFDLRARFEGLDLFTDVGRLEAQSIGNRVPTISPA